MIVTSDTHTPWDLQDWFPARLGCRKAELFPAELGMCIVNSCLPTYGIMVHIQVGSRASSNTDIS